MTEYPNSFVISNTRVEAGENTIVKMPVGSLSSGNRIYVQAHVYRSKQPGPVLLVLAGVHGDEINSVEILRRTIENKLFESLSRGTVIAVPLLNVYGFINFSREVPDGKDVNRSFPGNMKGSLASRVARILTKRILPVIDFGIDFHTGGQGHYNYPQIRYSRGDVFSEKLAGAFGAPYLVANSPIPKSLRKVALDAGKSILVYEGGENLRYDGFSIEKGLAGLKRLMHAQGMIETQEGPESGIVIKKTSWVRAAKAGMFRWSKPSGHKVYKGEPLGVISDPYGQDKILIFAPSDGHIIGHNNAPVVSQGDALFHIGYEMDAL